MTDKEKEEKEKIRRGLMAMAEKRLREDPPFRRLSAVMRGLRGEMQRRAAAGAALTPLAAYADEREVVAFFEGETREDLFDRLREMARRDGITTGGVCVPGGEGLLEIHGEDRQLPKFPILCFEPLHPPADLGQPLRGRRKKAPRVIFGPPD